MRINRLFKEEGEEKRALRIYSEETLDSLAPIYDIIEEFAALNPELEKHNYPNIIFPDFCIERLWAIRNICDLLEKEHDIAVFYKFNPKNWQCYAEFWDLYEENLINDNDEPVFDFLEFDDGSTFIINAHNDHCRIPWESQDYDDEGWHMSERFCEIYDIVCLMRKNIEFWINISKDSKVIFEALKND